METSDELEGVELAVAVAERLEYKIGEYEIDKSTMPSPFPRMMMWRDDHYEIYRPDSNIAQAWELDGEGWRWLFSEKLGGESFKFGPYAGNLLVRLWTKDDIFSYVVAVNPADFATKAHAYATARCRAYLKAKGADNDNE